MKLEENQHLRSFKATDAIRQSQKSYENCQRADQPRTPIGDEEDSQLDFIEDKMLCFLLTMPFRGI